MDNRRENLRIATRSQNIANQIKHTIGYSKFKGVTYRKNDQKWQAQIGKEYLGLFSSEVEAAKAYNEVVQQKYGEFSKQNKL